MSIRFSAAAVALAALGGCASQTHVHKAMHTPAFSPDTPPVSADMIGMDGSVIGSVSIVEGPNGVLGEVMLQPGSMEPGFHGMHIHQVGDCSDVGVFTNSGGHLGLIPGGHGLMNSVGPETGDLPNLHVAQDGSAAMEFFSNYFSISDLRDDDDAAMIIHQNRDDHVSQPIGGSGPRIACAVLK
ncbi:MAG: superoxide dismutase family protein [Pseudomonadota bacterium]